MVVNHIFTYNPGPTISGTTQVGNLAISELQESYGENYADFKWWAGPDETLGYVIAETVPSNTQPTEISGVTGNVGFWRSDGFSESAFVDLANNIFGQNFTTGSQAQNWLNNNGYWSSYATPIETNFILFQDGSIMTAQNGYSIEKQY